MRFLFHSAMFACAAVLGSAASANITDLECANGKGARWKIALDEGNGTASVTTLYREGGQKVVNSRAIFTPNDVQIDASGEFRDVQILIFVIDRTSLALRINSKFQGPGSRQSYIDAQCQIATVAERKF